MSEIQDEQEKLIADYYSGDLKEEDLTDEQKEVIRGVEELERLLLRRS
jgi:hypothetical protein